MKTVRPSVYLDQWVWVRLAAASIGEPREPSDLRVLDAVQQASQAGVLFPLSATHYQETARVTHPRQRADLARTMASVSHFRSLCSERILLRHQFLEAMHLSFGRPTFRPQAPQPLGIGAGWALNGKRLVPQLRGSSGPIDPASHPEMADFLRKAAQYTEYQLLAGPQDADVPKLHQLGYRPEEVERANQSRVDWETFYADLLADDPISRPELRVRVQAREIIHEHQKLLNGLFAEYHLDLLRAAGVDPDRPKASRRRMVAFADRIPSVRIAVDLKVELFRNAARNWTLNTVHDIDAVSLAVPYCHVVVPDRDIADLMDRSKAGLRNGTSVLRGLHDLPDVLAGLTAQVHSPQDGLGDEDWIRDGEAFCTDLAGLRPHVPIQNSTLNGS
ncbi:hypothetical protein ACWC3X_32565 [Streptomyces populi]